MFFDNLAPEPVTMASAVDRNGVSKAILSEFSYD